MSLPRANNAQELIIPTFTNWEKVGSITAILVELYNGQYGTATMLIDQFMRDDRLRAVWDTATQAVLGMPMHFETANHSAAKRSDKVCTDAKTLWPKMLPSAELTKLLRYGFFLGVGLAQVRWKRIAGAIIPVINTWSSGGLRWDRVTERYITRTEDGEVSIEPDDPNWLLFTPWGYKPDPSMAYLSSASELVLERQWTKRDRARRNEKHGQPLTQLVVPVNADARDKRTAANAIAALGTETVAITPQGTEGNRWDFKFWEPPASSGTIFEPTLKDIGECLAILVLGQTASTTGSSGLGSDANPGDVVRRDKMRFYASKISDIGADIMGDWSAFNYGDADLAPVAVIEVDPPGDANEIAQADLATAKAIQAMQLAGAPIDPRKYLEARGYGDYLMTEEEHAAAKQQAFEDAQKNATLMQPADDENDEGSEDGDEGEDDNG